MNTIYVGDFYQHTFDTSRDGNVNANLHRDLNKYINSFKQKPPAPVSQEHSLLSRREQMDEFVFLGLRLCEGISRQKFIDTFHQDFDLTYAGKLRKYTDMNLISVSGDTVRLTDEGIDVSNQILSDLLLD